MLKDLPSTNHKGIDIDQRDRVFCLLDKNGDGRISIEELTEVMEELCTGEDAREMMRLLDSNNNGYLSSDEFEIFQKQSCVSISVHRSLASLSLYAEEHQRARLREICLFY